jgi:hypothetical protein
LAEQSAINGQRALPLSGSFCCCWLGQQGMPDIASSGDIVTVAAARASAQACAATGAMTMPTIARIGRSRRNQDRIIGF